MYLNLFHRTATGNHYTIFREQQQAAHEQGLKTTIFLNYGDLFDDAVLEDARSDRDRYGDEIGLSLHGLKGPGLEELEGNQLAIWLFDQTRKGAILGVILEKWRSVFGSDPVSVGSYHLDSSALNLLLKLAPGVRNIIGGCFEEGVRVFHGCNHSWYLFTEGMPWNPWYPAKTHTLRPAQNREDAAGVVAVPHLMRDMSLSYEGRNDFWASHPPNVIRGMGNEASFCPYDLNLVDQFRMQEEWNNGYSYYNSFVSPSWLDWNHNSEYPPEIAWQLYRNLLQYLAQLKQSGAVQDMTLAEYGDWHRSQLPLAEPAVYLAKEMLYGSGKHYFWYIDEKVRILVDATQGGSIGDLRPYIGQVAVATGPDTEDKENAAYPYLVQSQYRTGFAHHYEDGSRTTLLVTHEGEEIDLAAVRTRVSRIQRSADRTTLELSPARLEFRNGTTCTLQSRLAFDHHAGTIRLSRKVLDASPATASFRLAETFKGAPGKTEYPVDLHGIALSVNGDQPAERAFAYSGLWHHSKGADRATACIPQTHTGRPGGQDPVHRRGLPGRPPLLPLLHPQT